MKITELAVKRPVTTVMFFIGMIIMGVISITRTPRELLPSMSYPQITVVTRYSDATPEEIERQITRVLEEAVGTVGRIQGINSISRDGLSLIIAEFMWGTDMNVASMDVREKIDLVKERLPRDSKEPIVIKYNPFELPVVTLILTSRSPVSGSEDLFQMKERAEDIIKNKIEKIDSVASVEIKGGREREIMVEVQQDRLMASDLSLLEVVQIIKNSNLTYPAGTIEKGRFEYLIKTDGEYKSIADIRNTPLKIARYEEREENRMRLNRQRETPKGHIFLSNIAAVKDTFKEKEGILRYNGREAIAIDIKRQSGSNVVEVARNIMDEVENIKKQLPEDYRLEAVYDQSEYVEKSIQGIASSALAGSVLAFLVLFVFLRSIKNSLVVALAIPVSLAGTFIFIYFNDISLNMMSLGGLALGIGMLVDSSIVVLENILRYNQQSPNKLVRNAISGTTEVTGAIMSSTLTTITVFFPFVFIAGVAGQLFKELAFTVTFSLIASFFVALTLIPRMASKINYSNEKGEPEWTSKLKRLYMYSLKSFFKKSGRYLLITLIAFLLCMAYLFQAGKEFIPRAGSDQFIMKVELPYGTVLRKTDETIRKIESILNEFEDVQDITSNIGASEGDTGEGGTYSLMGQHQAELSVSVKSRSAARMDNILSSLRNRIEEEDIEAEIEYVTQAGVIGSAIGGEAPIEVDIKGENIDDLIHIGGELVEEFEEIPFLYGAKSSFRGYRPEFNVVVNRDRASLYNISAQNITMAAQTAIKGYTATTFRRDDQEIDVKVRLAGGEGRRNVDIDRILVRSPIGIDVDLRQLADFGEDAVTPEITRKDGVRAVSVSSNYGGVSFARALGAVERVVENMQGKYGDYMLEISGDQKQIQESFKALIFVILLSILFVYMIMASQFESLWQPFIIIFTLPLSFIGVAAILFITGIQLSVIVLLGIIMLGGIVVNNGIVLISYYNFIEGERDMNLNNVIEASSTRLRPVLMTAVTTVLGLIPMALAGGEGAEFRSPLAITVIGGLLVSTFLTLYVVPVIYYYGRAYIIKIGYFIKNAGW
ncbi:MAG: efflux RND transporter permease subunit [Elusimicrobiota bacterium]